MAGSPTRNVTLVVRRKNSESNVNVFSIPPLQVRVWDVHTGEMVNTLIHHCEAVLHLRFYNGMMVTCSKDRSIAVWDMVSNNKYCNVQKV